MKTYLQTKSILGAMLHEISIKRCLAQSRTRLHPSCMMAQEHHNKRLKEHK